MDEEEELEDELRKLDVKEDLGEEDSDVTPTNTLTPSTPPAIVHLPHSSNTSGFFDGDFTRYSSCDDYDMRSDSSLSWGEDEFEGEATRIVNALFNQLDQIVYEDSLVETAKFPILKTWKSKERKHKRKKDVRETTKEEVLERDPFILHRQLSLSESSEDEAYDSAGRRSLDIPPPSDSLIAECKEWVANFPHLRVSGVGINVLNYERIEAKLLLDCVDKRVTEEGVEEVLAVDGDYENKLQFLTLKPEVCRERRKEKRSKGPPSRICSGSADPDLLREHILIKLFDHVWPVVSQITEPLLNQYAQFVINRSVQCSSFSRGSSTRGVREFPHIPSQELIREVIPDASETFPSVGWDGNRPVLSNSRPSSAMYRLSNRVPIKNIYSEDFSTILHISNKPLQLSDERHDGRSKSASRTRDSSAKSQSSLPSLPSLGNFYRPVSSRSGNHLLTPMSTMEQRPMSTSSFTRLRYNDKFNKLNRTTTIEEGGGAIDRDKESEFRSDNLSPTWSRHNSNSFLPRICDTKSQNKSQSQNSSSTLNVYGKSLSARSRNIKSEQGSPRKSSNAEPFVSWIVSKVEEQSNRVDPLVLTRTAKCPMSKSSSLPVDKTKYFRRFYHH